MHRHGGDIYRNQNKIDYSANINFLGMPQAVRQAAKDAIDDAVHYPLNYEGIVFIRAVPWSDYAAKFK